MNTEISIRVKDHGAIHVTSYEEDEVHLSIWILHAHTAVHLTKDQARQLIAALETTLQEQEA